MSGWTLPLEGGCRCGQVRFRIDGPPLVTMACHCTGCQRMTASAYSLSVMVPTAAFKVTTGQPVIGGLHGEIQHNFCPHCMSWMFTVLPQAPQVINVRAPMLDDLSWFSPFMESFTREKLPWAVTSAVHSFEAFPEPKDYPALMQAYAASVA